EGFDAQLQLQPRGDRHLLQQGEIHVLISGPLKDVASRAAEIPERRESERRCVEPPSFRWITEPSGTYQIRPIVRAESERRPPGVAVVHFGQKRDGEWPAALHRDNSAHSPGAEH